MTINRVTHKRPPRLADHFIENFTAFKNGAQGTGAARRMLMTIIPALNLWLECRGDGVSMELEGFERGVNSGLLHIRNSKDFTVVVTKARGDSVLAFNGRDIFLSGKEGAARLANAILEFVGSLDGEQAVPEAAPA